MLVFSLITISILLKNLPPSDAVLACHSCQGGYGTNCAIVVPGEGGPCEKGGQCYEAVKWFQNGAIKLVERRCWVPPKYNKNATYCDSFKNPVGVLKSCTSCKKSQCNGHKFNPDTETFKL